jgi:hypothetical protein
MTKETPDQEMPDRRANTEARIQDAGAKRMPHERDEAPDEKENLPRGVMKQAASDLAEGLVDTDLHGQRGVEQAVQHGDGDSSGQAKPQPDAAEGMRHQTSNVPPTTPPKGFKQ